MRVYVDSSALLKRVIVEPNSAGLIAFLGDHAVGGDALICSSLGWVEISRALRTQFGDHDDLVNTTCDTALSGVLERPITPEVVALARRLPPSRLRSLDAIHLASAILVDADEIVAYDQRLLDAARFHGLQVSSPGSE